MVSSNTITRFTDLSVPFRIVDLVIGYVLAVLVATGVTVFLVMLPTIFPDNGALGSFFAQIYTVPGMLLIGAMYTGMFAGPGYLATLYLAHRKAGHTSGFYARGGVLTALSAHLLMALFVGALVFRIYDIFICSTVGGLVGALACWRWRRWLHTRLSREGIPQ